MKFILALFFITLGLRGEMEFSGFFINAQETRVSITNTESHRSSAWLKVGQPFEGCTITAFDRDSEIITLKQGERLLRIRLRTSKTKEGRVIINGSLKFMKEQMEGVRASLFIGEESTFPLKSEVIFRIKPELMPDGNILYRAKFVTIGTDGVEQILSAPALVAVPGKPFSITIGDYGYSFTP